MDGCSAVVAPQMAESKARVAVGFKISSREFGEKYASQKSAIKMAQMGNMCQISNLAMFPGGCVIRNKDGRVIGGVGVSGASGEEDEELAMLGAAVVFEENENEGTYEGTNAQSDATSAECHV